MPEWHTRDPLRPMRVTALLQSAVLFVQAVTAGLLLASVPAGRTAHGVMAGAVVLVVLLNVLAAVLAWRPGGGSPRLVFKSLPMLVFALVQAALGYAHVRELHVPVGVLMFAASVLLLTQVRSAKPTRHDVGAVS
ncbi:hypothetical protein [Actinocorallia populi]|uniref:hypothetical protein n=1 Tax=Actinocorallia populi TaxID=2079200 RepID=UPI000D0945F8|nr:hypothetical protein [Actinocorallia populi]